jgi:hypothetical protein
VTAALGPVAARLVAAGGSSPLSGTLVVLALVLACVGIFYALNRSLRKVRTGFPTTPVAPDPSPTPPAAESEDQSS